MEILFYGDKQKMNKLYFALVIMAIFLNYLSVEYSKIVNIFIPIMGILLVVFSISYLKQMISVFFGKDFINFLKCDFARVKGFMIFSALIFMGMSISLMNENAIILFNYDFLFIQRSIAICMFVVCIMNVDVMSKIIPIDFKKESQVAEIEKKEIFFSREIVNQSILNISNFLYKSKSKNKNDLSTYGLPNIAKNNTLNSNNIDKGELTQLFHFLKKENVILDSMNCECFLRDFLRIPIKLNFSVRACRDFYNIFYSYYSHLKVPKPNEFTKLFINTKNGELYKVGLFSKSQLPQSKQYEKIIEFFADLKKNKKRSI